MLWQRDGVPTFCLEGTAITAGAAITWLRDGLGIIATPEESAAARRARSPTPAGCGRSRPSRGSARRTSTRRARAVIGGLSRATTRAHVVRAVLEGIAWRCREVYDALRADSPHPPPATLRADGGAARNDVLLQLQADALGLPVERPAVLEAGALGAGVPRGARDRRLARAPTSSARPGVATASSSLSSAGDEREARFAAWRRHVRAAQDGAGS